MRKASFILIGLSALSLSACGTWLDREQPQVGVQMREDTGDVMTPMTPPLRADGVSHVVDNTPTIGATVYPGAVPAMGTSIEPAMPVAQEGYGYGAGVPASDPSVTIFPLDGAPAPVAQNYSMGGGGHFNATPYGYGGGSAEGQIFFKHGSSRLGSGDMSKLSTVADQARFAPVGRITVEGHASQPTQAGSQSVESHILNLKESMNRSFAVSKTLMQKGVPAEKLKTVSWGSTKASGNESQDRRVDVTMGER